MQTHAATRSHTSLYANRGVWLATESPSSLHTFTFLLFTNHHHPPTITTYQLSSFPTESMHISKLCWCYVVTIQPCRSLNNLFTPILYNSGLLRFFMFTNSYLLHCHESFPNLILSKKEGCINIKNYSF